jgi:hypothetical protein
MKKALLTLILLLISVPASALTKAQMQLVATTVINAGYEADAIPQADGSWTLRAKASTWTVAVADANAVAVGLGVNGYVAGIQMGPMTAVKAQAVSAAVTDAGYRARAFLAPTGGLWLVRAYSERFDVPISTAVAFATSQTVNAFVAEVEFR